MIDFVEICRRASSGPLMPESTFDRERFYPALKQLIRKYEIRADLKNPVSTDDALADAIWNAAVDLVAEVGMYCTDSQRVLQFTREEVKQAIRNAPGPRWFGEGHDRHLFRPRKPDDHETPAWCHVGGSVAMSSEELLFRVVEGFARIPEADSHTVPPITHLRGVPVVAGSPQELLASIRTTELARAAIRQAGHPGRPILNLISNAGSAASTLGASNPVFGTRASDGWLVGTIAEMKVDFGALSKVAFLTSWGASVGSESAPLLGGYAGGPEGVAITSAAYTIVGTLVLKGSYHLNFPMDVAYSCSSSRRLLWSLGAGCQAISRNISYPVFSLCYNVGGPMTETYFYETAAYALTAVCSGSSYQTPMSCKALKVDYESPLGMQFAAEVSRAAHRISRAEANGIVNRLLEQYEGDLDSPPEAQRFQECHDVATGSPKPEWLEMYREMRRRISNMGVPLEE